MNFIEPESKCCQSDVTYDSDTETWYCDDCGNECQIQEGNEYEKLHNRELDIADARNDALNDDKF